MDFFACCSNRMLDRDGKDAFAPGGDLFRGCKIDLVVHMTPGRKLVVGRRCGRRDDGENGAAEEGKRHRRSPAA